MELRVQPKFAFSKWIIFRQWPKDITEKIVTHSRQKFVEHLIQKLENTMKEKIKVLNYIDAFNTQSKADSAKSISELAKYYGQPKQDIF